MRLQSSMEDYLESVFGVSSIENIFDTCDVCNEPSNEMMYHTYWGQRSCEEHDYDGTLMCSYCHRFQKGEYVNLGDGRKLCSDCYSIAIMDPKQFKPIIEKVHEFYKFLYIEVDKDIPIMLVDKDEMCRIYTEEMAIGLTLLGTPSRLSVLRITKCSKSGANIEATKKVKTLNARKWKSLFRSKSGVITILLLFGFPDVIMGATLAHEFMHAWLKSQGCRELLESSVEEGICQIMAHKWMRWFQSSYDLDSAYKTNKQAQVTRVLKDFETWGMKTWDDEIYGEGFREAMRAVCKYEFNTTLSHIVEKGSLPTCQGEESDIHELIGTAGIETLNLLTSLEFHSFL